MQFPVLKGPNGAYLKELTFRSGDSKMLEKTCKQIKGCKTKKKKVEAQVGGVAKITPLVPSKDKRVHMDHLTIRPNLTGKKTQGVAEAFSNGLRFTPRSGSHVDVNYSNIKHFFFQPCEDELIMLIHLNLKKGQILNGKHTMDIQFYTEVGSLVDDLDNRRGRHMNDQEELEAEQRERENKKKLNEKFKRFSNNIKVVAESNGFDLILDIPYHELSFIGAPGKSSVKIMPSQNCLVQLTEMPFFVQAINDIEHIHFERVHFSIRNFDMALIQKDFTTFNRICSIPIEQLDTIKAWANQVDLFYTEGPMALNWTNILDEIRGDFEAFLDEGAWRFLSEQQEEGEQESEEESEFNEEEDASSGGSESSSFSEEDEESSSASPEEPSDSEGMDWDELDKKAKESDRKNAAAFASKERKRR